jgi:hypothetical protein
MTWDALINLIPLEQREQLAEILIRQLGRGYGQIEIVIENHRIKFFSETTIVKAEKDRER